MNSKPPRGSAPTPDHIMLSLNGDTKTQRTVTWRTSEDVPAGYALYWEAGTDEILRQDADNERFDSDIDSSWMHWAHLQNLKPGAAYEYTCGDDSNRAGPFSFAMPATTEKFKFICLTDQQRGDPFERPDYSEFNAYLKQLLREHPDTAFFLTAGDNTDCGQHEVQWNGLFSGLVGVAEHVPFMMALGNHDNRGFADYRHQIGRYYSEPGEFFCKQFRGSYPYNGPEGWKTENYYFDYGNARFNFIGLTGDEERNQWMLETVGGCGARWKLGVWHFPVCPSGVESERLDYPPLREGMACFDLMFEGHIHNFCRSFPMRGEELFDRPSEGTVHYMLGNSGRNPPGSQTVQKVWHTAWYPMEERLACACIAEIEGDRMTLTSVLEDGRVADRCVIDKGRDEISPPALAPRYRSTRMLFKGMELGLCQADTPCERRDGVWFCPLAILIAYLGGGCEKTAGQCRLELYGHWAIFTEGSDRAQTDRGDLTLPAPVYRGARAQLYIPAQGAAAFDLFWAYAARNNFLLFEHDSEEKPVTLQP